MSLLLKNGQVYYKNKLQNLDILIENDQIKKVENDISDNAEEIKDLAVYNFSRFYRYSRPF